MRADPRSRLDITPEVLLKAYSIGVFPMAESAEDPGLFWVEPELRGILPLDSVHIPRRLVRTIRQAPFEIRIDQDFDAVIDGCARSVEGRPKTWINARIRRLYRQLFELGHCHTVEAWHEGNLVGGLYGLQIGAAFFGESMFRLVRDASKVALVHLIARLRAGGFTLLDTQFITAHLERFGAIEVGREEYQQLLDTAINGNADFYRLAGGGTSDDILQLVSQTS